ncbi:CoA transferase [Streptomyces sp. NBC_01754]|uniref:CoA transferase n=1 Tax=Streptomyces sp. NBC_01754 TaxID=2975930 RepID=UPI002DD7B78E|nr:CoA transferase [Streptomyces sp. NBC_01754]WSC94901.1 CoA transferase [Streptomyces sp. NBC_01754]
MSTATPTLVTPATTAEVTARLLRSATDGVVPPGAVRAVRLTADWAGPVSAPLTGEDAVQAACGIMHVHGRAAGRPLPLGVDYAATAAGVLAAQGVCAVLLARHRGLGLDEVRTSAAQGALLALSQYLAAATAPVDDSGPTEPTAPGGATLVSAEGTAFEIETLDPEAWRGFWHRLGVPARTAGRGWEPFRQRFATAVCPLPGELRAAVRSTPLAALGAAAAAEGVSLVALPDDPAFAAAAEPVRLTAGPLYAPVPAAGTPGGALPLAGVRVVESTSRVQGPLAGHVLRLLGAEVVRVEPPGGDPMRGLPPLARGGSARHSALNAGKRVVEADLRTAAGRDTVRELVAGADVFVHNWAPGRASRLGLDAEDLWRIRPGLVHAGASGFGDAYPPGLTPIGTDYLAQARSGLAAALRPAGEVPAPSLMTLTDVLGGLLCAHAVVAGLLSRAHRGHGVRAASSLLSAAGLVPRPPVRRRAPSPLELPVRTADGCLYLGERTRTDLPLLARLTGPGAAGPRAVAARFGRRPTGRWLELLDLAGASATEVCTDLGALPRDPRFLGAVDPAPPGGHATVRSPWTFA